MSAMPTANIWNMQTVDMTPSDQPMSFDAAMEATIARMIAKDAGSERESTFVRNLPRTRSWLGSSASKNDGAPMIAVKIETGISAALMVLASVSTTIINTAPQLIAAGSSRA